MKTLLDKPVLFHDPDYHKKVLLFDIETAPNLSYVWGKWEQNTLAVEKHWYMISFAYKWLGEKQTYVLSLPDFKEYKKDPTNDEPLVKELWKLFDQAEVIIAHNGDTFDIKKSNGRFLKYGLEPPTPYKTIDTLKIARKYLKLDSNKLDDLGDYLKIGRKIRTGGFDLWFDCIKGDRKAWKHMCDYNKRDVILLEKVYYKLRSWAGNLPNMNIILNGTFNCPTCGSSEVHKRGFSYTRIIVYQRFKCLNCGAWSRGEAIKADKLLR